MGIFDPPQVKITALPELTTLSAGDILPVVDVSDTSGGAAGTTKKITQSNLYNFGRYGDVAALATHRAARSNRHSAPHKILFIGHSFVEGSVSNVINECFVRRFRDLWRARFPVVNASGVASSVGGEGWVSDMQLWHPFTYTGGAVSRVSGANSAPYGMGLYSSEMPVGSTLSYTFTGTGVTVYTELRTGRGTLSASIDGGAAVTKSLVGVGFVDDMAPWVVATGLTPGTHTIVLTASVALCYVDGLFITNGDDTTGTWVYNGGHGGATSRDFNRAASGAVSLWTGYAAKYIIPQTVIICGPYNDWRLGGGSSTVDPPSSLAQFQILIDTFNAVPSASPDPSIILINEWRGGSTTLQADYYGGTAGYDQYTANMYTLEAQYPNVSILDLGLLVPPPFDDNALGLVYGDFVHPNTKGHAFIADMLVHLLAQ